MYYSERQQQILTILSAEQSVSVHRLARLLSISESSVRRDLKHLEDTGRLRRSFGGAVLLTGAEAEVALTARKSQHLRQKEEIAAQAAKHVQDGQLIFLDASSTAACLIPLLGAYRDITVVTNSPLASLRLSEMKIHNYCTGGLMLNQSMALVGQGAEAFLQRFQADVVFFSCRGLSEDGVLSDSLEAEVQLRSAMLERAEKKIFLCDRSKWGQRYHFRLCALSDIDEMISEGTPCVQPIAE